MDDNNLHSSKEIQLFERDEESLCKKKFRCLFAKVVCNQRSCQVEKNDAISVSPFSSKKKIRLIVPAAQKEFECINVDEFSSLEFEVQEMSTNERETYKDFADAYVRTKENGYEMRENSIEAIIQCLFNVMKVKNKKTIFLFSAMEEIRSEEQDDNTIDNSAIAKSESKLNLSSKTDNDYAAIFINDQGIVGLAGPKVDTQGFEYCHQALEMVANCGYRKREPIIENLVNHIGLPSSYKIVMVLSNDNNNNNNNNNNKEKSKGNNSNHEQNPERLLVVAKEDNKNYVALCFFKKNMIFVVEGAKIDRTEHKWCSDAMALVNKMGYTTREPMVEDLVNKVGSPYVNWLVLILSKTN